MLNTESALRKDKRTGLSDMQHRHFTTIATIIRSWDGDADGHGRRELAEHFADLLPATNSRFDRARFLKACED